jgi:hypothetical protein
MRSEAYLSEDRVFRYWLLRVWTEDVPIYATISSNPSVADELENDPTIRKVMGFGKLLGYGGVLMLNVGAFRATDPKDWKDATDPFGPRNTIECLQTYLEQFKPALVVAAWGKPCMLSQRGQHRAEAIKKAIPGMKCWGRNADGSPRHPLMLPYTTTLEPFN